MKKQLFLSIISAAAFISLSASDAPSGAPVIEVSNKQDSSIQLNIAEIGPNGGRKNYPTVYVQSMKRWDSGQRAVDMNSVIEITISNQGQLAGRYVLYAPGKTKYVTWNPTRRPSLYPQTGPLGGFGKIMGMKTDSGLSLKNNLSGGQIEEKRRSQ